MMPRRNKTLFFLTPWLLTLGVFHTFPILYSACLSLMHWSPLAPDKGEWIGLGNYAGAFHDPFFWKAMGNTFFFAVGTIPFTTGISLILAVLLNGPVRGRAFFRAGFFLPFVVSLVVVALVFKNIYAPYGPLNRVLESVGLSGAAWLQNPKLALPAIMAMDVWASIGYYTVIILAGLQAIPDEVHEAAVVDGAGWWARLRLVTVPMLKPVLLFVVVINTIKSFQVFIEIFVMTSGGPLNSTLTAVYYIYDQAFHRLDMGYASAVAYLLFAAILLVTLLQMKRFRAGSSVGGA
jgi:multiple sugar transport system permease protein